LERREVVALMGAGLPALAALRPERLWATGIEAHGAARRAGAPRLPAAQQELVEALAEAIIPRTDTPGAREAGVAGFIAVIVAEYYTAAERDAFERGLADVEARARAVLGVPFATAGAAQQAALLTGLEAEARALRRADPTGPTPFFSRLKGLVLHGYYTSEIGMRDELHWQQMPGRFDGCVELGAVPAPPGGN
jgi:hypothetical protein